MRRRVLSPLPILIFLAMLALLVGLGLWQLQRAEEKSALLALHERQQSMAAVRLNQLTAADDPAWRPVQLQGRFDTGHSLLLDNRSRDGRAGVELLQPFADRPSGLWVLVNRGWLPWPDRRTPPAYVTPDTLLDLKAWVYVPPGPAFHLRRDPAGTDWPRLVTALDPPLLWAELGRQGYAHEVRLLPGLAAYRTDWPVVSQAPLMHRGYALQWFSLAGALVGLYLYLGLTAPPRAKR